MKLVIDSGRVIAALIKDSTCRKIILSDKFILCTPVFSINEIIKYSKYICGKAKINKAEFYNLLFKLFDHLNFIEDSLLMKSLKEANDIIGKIDKKDMAFIACALCIKCDGIWSDDKHFGKQDKIKIWKTKDIIKLL